MSIKRHEEKTFTYPPGATRIVITGPETEITQYKMTSHVEQHDFTWSFAEKGEYLVRYMDEYGVEHGTETVKVK